MPDTPPFQQDPVEYEDWLREERTLPLRRILAAICVLGVIVSINLYFMHGGVQRRVDYALLRARSAAKRLRPHDLYLPTPDLGRAQIARQPTANPDLDKGSQDSAKQSLLTPPPPARTSVAAAPTATPAPSVTPADTSVPKPAATANTFPLPRAILLEADCHEPQGWNNCGPATLAMVLRFYGWTEDQYTVATSTKPDRDDKNVSPEEMVAYAHSLGDMTAVMGYATDTDLLKRLLSAGYPVIVETWFVPEPDDEMGHYRLLTGYDDVRQEFTTQDSYQGADQAIPYADLEDLWKVFNRVFVVVTKAEQAPELQALLGDGRSLSGNKADHQTMYHNALAIALAEIDADPEDRYAWFNAGTNYLGLGQYEQAASAYDQARLLKLPWRMLWYQFGPFEAYLRAGRYQDIIDLADANLHTTTNLEESYYYRGLARRARGDESGAQQDLETALRYNPHYRQAAEALNQ
jgi:hypothetical protein